MIGQKQPGSVEYFNYSGSMATYDVRGTCEIKSSIAMAKLAFNKKNAPFTSKVELNLRQKLVKYYIWSIALCGAVMWTLQKVDQKYLGSSETWCWRRIEVSWTDPARNEDVLERVKVGRNILKTIKRGKANWIACILRWNCLLQHVVEGKIVGSVEVTGR
jgi:hypothetical protein